MLIIGNSTGTVTNSTPELDSNAVKLDPKRKLAPEIYEGVLSFFNLNDLSAVELVNKDWSERKVVEKVLKAAKKNQSSKVIKHLNSLFNVFIRDKTCYKLAEMYILKNDIDNADLFISKIVNPIIKDKAHLSTFEIFLQHERFNHAEFNARQITNPFLKDKALAQLVFKIAQADSQKAYRLAREINSPQVHSHAFANVAHFSIKNEKTARAESSLNHIETPQLRLEARKKLYFAYLKKGKIQKAATQLQLIARDPLLKDIIPPFWKLYSE